MSSRLKNQVLPSAPHEPSAATTLDDETIPEQIQRILEEQIIYGQIPPRTRLRADDLAERFNVSRIPIREALRSLHEAGWVEIRPRHGTYVCERSLAELHELFEVRKFIEPQISALAAERRSPQELSQLQTILANSSVSTDETSMHSMAALSGEFNAVVRHACRNSIIANFAATLEKRAQFYFSMVQARLKRVWLETEYALYEAIELGRIEDAANITRAHMVETGVEVANLLAAESLDT